MKSTARKLLVAGLVLVGSVLLLPVNGWFSLGLVVALPVVILLWIDFGRELRSSPSTTRTGRIAGLLMGVPQALFGLVCAAVGMGIICWVLYNSFWRRDPHYTGGFMTLGIGPVLSLFGGGLVVDAFRRSSPPDDV